MMNLNGIIVGAAVFSCFWGIHEIIAQEKRVLHVQGSGGFVQQDGTDIQKGDKSQ